MVRSTACLRRTNYLTQRKGAAGQHWTLSGREGEGDAAGESGKLVSICQCFGSLQVLARSCCGKYSFREVPCFAKEKNMDIGENACFAGIFLGSPTWNSSGVKILNLKTLIIHANDKKCSLENITLLAAATMWLTQHVIFIVQHTSLW